MSTASGADWFYREGGAVRWGAWGVADPAPLLLESAFEKTIRGEDLSDPESAALAAYRASEASDAPGVFTFTNSADAKLGMVSITRRDTLKTLDAMAVELGAIFGNTEVAGWQFLQDYCTRALSVAREEAGIGHDDVAALVPLFASPERVGEITADWSHQVAEAQAWVAGLGGLTILDDPAGEPDGGPEGWSQQPPSDPAHPVFAARMSPDGYRRSVAAGTPQEGQS